MGHLIHTILTNPIFTVGAGLGVAGSLFASLRTIPATIWSFCKRKVITSVNIISQDDSYDKFSEWLTGQDSCKKTKLLQLETFYGPSAYSDSESAGSYTELVPAPGPHILDYKGHKVWVSKERHRGQNDQYSLSEEITLSVMGGPDIIRDMLKDVTEYHKKKSAKFVKIFFTDKDNCWREFTRKIPRSLESVVLKDNLKESVVVDLESFYSSFDKYQNLGIPYHRTYLFHGPPGNGKSSIVEALAGKFKKNLYVLNLANKMDDYALSEAMLSVPNNGILLIEDIDAAFINRQNQDAQHATFSGLLNSLDGVSARSGQVVMMSTNHIDKLDAALLRPGRTDMKVLIDNPETEQIIELYGRFFPEKPDSIKVTESAMWKGMSMASVQEKLKEMAA